MSNRSRRWLFRGTAAVISLVVLTSTPASAVPQQEPALEWVSSSKVNADDLRALSRPTPIADYAKKTQLEWVDASKVPADQLKALPSPTPLRTYAQQRGITVPPAQPATAPQPKLVADLREECKAHPEANTADGWTKSRFESCIRRPRDLVLQPRGGGASIGRMQFVVWMIGFAYDGSRKADYFASIEDITVAPGPSENPLTWRIGQMFSHSIGGGGAVTPPADTDRDDLLPAWDSIPQWTLTYTSPDSGVDESSAENYQIVSALVSMDINASSPNASPYVEADAGHNRVRFDYGGNKAGKFKGTVFTDAKVYYKLRLSDSTVKQAARHIDDALRSPVSTFPSWVGKSVPGGDEARPLHRIWKDATIEANRRAARATCDNNWGAYNGDLLNCDEYPFATTQEGAASSGKYSARLINRGENTAAGIRLQSMYTENRMLPGDAFFVAIEP